MIATTVFDKHCWVHTILMTEELAHALDSTSVCMAVMTNLDIERLTKVEVPEKVPMAGQSCLQ